MGDSCKRPIKFDTWYASRRAENVSCPRSFHPYLKLHIQRGMKVHRRCFWCMTLELRQTSTWKCHVKWLSSKSKYRWVERDNQRFVRRHGISYIKGNTWNGRSWSLYVTASVARIYRPYRLYRQWCICIWWHIYHERRQTKCHIERHFLWVHLHWLSRCKTWKKNESLWYLISISLVKMWCELRGSSWHRDDYRYEIT